MPKLFSSRQVIKALGRKGFVHVSQKGSHVGTFRSILRQSGLTEKDFKK